MKQNPMKLGVLALLLLVISVCLTTLSVLTFSTAQADLRLTERYAETTRQQYLREGRGQAFLQEADAVLKRGGVLTEIEGVTKTGSSTFEKTVTEGNAVLRICLKVTSRGTFEIISWETSTQWTPGGQTGGPVYD